MTALKRFFTFAMILASLGFSSCTLGTMPVTATSNETGEKKGVAKSSYLFALVPLSDGGVAKAAENGDIDKISTVDVKVKTFLFWTQIKTVVHGE